MSEKFNSLQKKINIKFKNLNYLKKSVTHKSYNSVNNYEKLEFLGDRILGFVISNLQLQSVCTRTVVFCAPACLQMKIQQQ